MKVRGNLNKPFKFNPLLALSYLLLMDFKNHQCWRHR
jgi:hypothetical protein